MTKVKVNISIETVIDIDPFDERPFSQIVDDYKESIEDDLIGFISTYDTDMNINIDFWNDK